MRCIPALLLMAGFCLRAQTGPANPDFEKGREGAAPDAWFVPAAFQSWRGTWTPGGCVQGTGCVQLAPGAEVGDRPGNIMQTFDATPFRGQRVRYRAAVNVEAGGSAGLWLRVDRPGGQMGFFENMQSKPIATNGDWRYFQIDGFVHADAEKIALGILSYRKTVLFDDVSFAATGELPKMTEEPPRVLSSDGLRNLTVLAELLGIVRFFHPSDEATAADWNRFAIEAVRKIEPVAPGELASALQSVFQTVAPTIRVFSGATPPKPHPALSAGENLSIFRWHHSGIQLNQGNVYRSERVKKSSDTWNKDDVLGVQYEGVKALVPLAVFTDAMGTLPRADLHSEQTIPMAAWSPNDRATRLADVILAWSLLEHFYPYFDVVQTNWKLVLPAALKNAAIDKDGIEFHNTLRRMIAELKDGHGQVLYTGMKPLCHVPLMADWMENKLIVTSTIPEVADAKAGDEIVSINGSRAAAALAQAEKLISGATPQWKRSRSTSEVLMTPRGEELALEIRPFGATELKTILVACNAQMPRVDARPKNPIGQLDGGIWYVDLTRAQDADVQKALPDLAVAKGIVFDMRGYPRVSPAWFSHVTKTPLRSAQWHVPQLERPGQMTFNRQGEWDLQPKEPYLSARKVFLTNGSAISYAESTMGIVEYYKLGEIVGETTAGTNGNVNPLQLPGGYMVTWTGMKVLKHDGSQHHGVGIRPTVPVSRTQAGVAVGRDEVLERGIALLNAQ